MVSKFVSTRSRRNRPMSEINVTPFVDVMLVLLIVFMVTAPMLTAGVSVNLPDSSANSLPDEKEPLALTINSKGEVFIQNTQISLNDLTSKVLVITKNRIDTRIYVRGDRSLEYGKIMEVMGLLSRAGFTKVALVSESSRGKK
jgi:biopolymer transport protein TolR